MGPRLLFISGSQTGTVRPLIDGHISIGLGAGDELYPMDAVAARRQCTIDHVDGEFEIVDPGSHLGTFVNGIPVRHRIIVHGDTIRVGKSELVFLVHADETTGAGKILLSDEAPLLRSRKFS